MKSEKQKEARELRKAGYSVREIEKKIGVARSSVSVWVRDVPLSKEQKEKLLKQKGSFKKGHKWSKERSEKYEKIRANYRQEGYEIAKNNKGELFITGCMLYWAEGAKSRNSFQIANTDVRMLKIIMQFLLKEFDADINRIKIHVNCYSDGEKTIPQIEKYWLNQLGLPKTALNKTIIRDKYRSKKRVSQNTHVYGICNLRINQQEIVQKVYGAINYYVGEMTGE